MDFKLISFKHGIEICTFAGAFEYRSLFAVFYDGHIFAVDILLIHVYTYRR